MKSKIFYSLFLFILLISCDRHEAYPPYGGGNGGNNGTTQTANPQANFSIKKINPLKIELINRSTDATSYSWDFGDGNKSTETNPVHKYNKKGVYKITLKASKNGKSHSVESTITIEEPTKIYVIGVSYEKISVQNEYFKIKLTDDDIITTTWFHTKWVLLSSANIPYNYPFENPIILDDMKSDDWYKASLIYSTNKSKENVLFSGKFYTSNFFNSYPEKITFEDSKNKFTLFFDYK